MKASELREKSVEDLNQELLDALKEQFNLRLRKSTGKLTQPHLMTENRKNIARIKTVLTQKAGE